MTEVQIVGGHHQLNRHEFEQAPGVGDGQGSLACCSSWGREELDTIVLQNSTERKWRFKEIAFYGSRLRCEFKI